MDGGIIVREGGGGNSGNINLDRDKIALQEYQFASRLLKMFPSERVKYDTQGQCPGLSNQIAVFTEILLRTVKL